MQNNSDVFTRFLISNLINSDCFFSEQREVFGRPSLPIFVSQSLKLLLKAFKRKMGKGGGMNFFKFNWDGD